MFFLRSEPKRPLDMAETRAEDVTAMDRERHALIAQFHQIPRQDHQARKTLLGRINDLQNKRLEAVRPRSFEKMLASLG